MRLRPSACVLCCPSPNFKPGNLRCVKFDSMLSRISPTKGVKGESDPRGLPCMSIFLPPHPLSSRKFKKIPKITFSSISPYSHNISFSPSSLHFRPDFSLLPIVYLPPLNSGKIVICVHSVCKSTYPFSLLIYRFVPQNVAHKFCLSGVA